METSGFQSDYILSIQAASGEAKPGARVAHAEN